MSRAKAFLVLALCVLATVVIQAPIGPTRVPIADESIIELPPAPLPLQYVILAFFVGLGVALGSIVAFLGFLLSMFDLAPTFAGQFSLLNLVLSLVTLATMLTALLIGGPTILYNAIKEYTKEEAGEE